MDGRAEGVEPSEETIEGMLRGIEFDYFLIMTRKTEAATFLRIKEHYQFNEENSQHASNDRLMSGP